MPDCLKQEFYQLTQGKTAKVQQFAGRLEAKYKQLREKIPGTYEKSMLKERLFHRMHQGSQRLYPVLLQKGQDDL